MSIEENILVCQMTCEEYEKKLNNLNVSNF